MGMRTQASAGKPRLQPLGRGQKQEPGLCLPGPPEAPQVVPGFPRTALLLLGWDWGGTILLITAAPKPSSPSSLGPLALNVISWDSVTTAEAVIQHLLTLPQPPAPTITTRPGLSLQHRNSLHPPSGHCLPDSQLTSNSGSNNPFTSWGLHTTDPPPSYCPSFLDGLSTPMRRSSTHATPTLPLNTEKWRGWGVES